MKIRIKLFLISFLIMIGCDETLSNTPVPIPNNLNIYDVWKQLTDLEPDENGYFHFFYQPTGNYSDSDYGTVKYRTDLPVTRVFWDSPDEYCYDMFGTEFCESIICCSTYSGDDGYGQQLFYIYEPHIGDTLTIYGSISSEYIGSLTDSVFVIINE